jgi:hypothetical protein
MSISDMPPRQGQWQLNARGSQRVSIHGGQGVDDRRWAPYSEDGDGKERGPRKYGKAIRMTCEIKSVTDIDVVDVRPSRMTPPGAQPSRVVDYV